jgi:hypothetical protein
VSFLLIRSLNLSLPLKKILLLLILTPEFASAQKVLTTEPNWPKMNLTAGYYGNLVTNPGLNFGLEYALLEKIKTKSKIKRGSTLIKYKTKRLELNPTIGFYLDPGGHLAIFKKANIQYKKINNHRRTFTVAMGIGYYHSFIRKVYDADKTTISENSGIKGSGYFAPEFKMGIGRAKVKNDKFKGWYLNASSQFLFNYNSTILPLPALELGLRF